MGNCDSQEQIPQSTQGKEELEVHDRYENKSNRNTPPSSQTPTPSPFEGDFSFHQYLSPANEVLSSQSPLTDSKLSDNTDEVIENNFQELIQRIIQKFIPAENATLFQEKIHIKTKDLIKNIDTNIREWNKILLKKQKKTISEHFSILEKLGAGAFGEVVRGFDMESRKFYAIKTYSKGDKNAIKQEIETMLNLAQSKYSKHLLSMVKIEQEETKILNEKKNNKSKKKINIYLEYGLGSLQDYLNFCEQSDYKLSVSTVHYIMAELFKQLALLGQLKVAHRDIKPENILILENGSVKLADFGISSFYEKPFTPQQIGTLEFMAPELKKNIKEQKKFNFEDLFACDLYSLGKVLEKLLSITEKLSAEQIVKNLVESLLSEYPEERVSSKSYYSLGQIINNVYLDFIKGPEFLLEFENYMKLKIFNNISDNQTKLDVMEVLEDNFLGNQFLGNLEIFISKLKQNIQLEKSQSNGTLDDSTQNILVKALLLLSRHKSQIASNMEESQKIAQEALDIASQLNNNIAILSNCYFRIGYIHQSNSQYDKALKNYKECLNLRQQIYEEIDPKIIQCHESIANIYFRKKLNQKAFKIYETCICKLQQQNSNSSLLAPENSLQVANCYTNLANILQDDKTTINQAIEYYEKALKIYKNKYGTKHPAVALCYYNFSSIYTKIKDGQKFNDCIEEALSIYSEIFGYWHPKVAECYISQAFHYRDNEKNYYGAFSLLLEAREILMKNFGDKHLQTAMVNYNIAKMSEKISGYLEVKYYFEEALEGYLFVYGENNEYVAHCCLNLGNQYKNSEPEKAKELYLKAKQIYNKLGVQFVIDIALCARNLISVYRDLQDFTQSIKSGENALKVFQKNLGAINEKVASCYLSMAKTYHAMKDFTKFEKNTYKSLKMYENLFEEDSKEIISCYEQLSSLFEESEQNASAIDCLKKLIRAYQKQKMKQNNSGFISNEQQDLKIIECYYRLGVLHTKIMKYSQAEEFLQKALDCIPQESGFGGMPLLKFRPLIYKQFAIIYKNLGQKQKAMQCYQKEQKFYGHSYEKFDLAKCKRNQASILFDEKKYGQAKELIKKANKIEDASILENSQYSSLIEDPQKDDRGQDNKGAFFSRAVQQTKMQQQNMPQVMSAIQNEKSGIGNQIKK